MTPLNLFIILILLVVGPTTTTPANALASASSTTPSSSSDISNGGGSDDNKKMKMPSLPLLGTKMAKHLPLAKKALTFLDSSPDPFHAVQTSIDMLEKAGFQELKDSSTYGNGLIKPGGKYYFTRNKSTIVAFAIGNNYEAGSSGFKVIGCHTDSPNLKVKPRSKRSGSGYLLIGVETYGGGLWHTWFDRDLGISGRVLVRKEESGAIEQKLVKIDRAVLRVSNLAIHLRTADERKSFTVNKEDHLSPILALEAKKALSGSSATSDSSDNASGEESTKSDKKVEDGWTEHQEPLLLQLLAAELGVSIESIADFELNLFDIQQASLGGVCSEFIHSARLDNLASCFLAISALLEHVEDESFTNDKDVSLVAMFDHEEVGSSSAVGAGSPIMSDAVERIAAALNGENPGYPDLIQSTKSRSFILSVDQSHAVHPNYASKHEKAHQPKMNEGMVIKRNSNQRYATNGITGFIVREIARRAGLPPVQEFVVRQDCACGSTIGPIISSQTGIRCIDMGCPQLSMHSIRETMGIADLTSGLDLFKAYFKLFREVDDAIEQ